MAIEIEKKYRIDPERAVLIEATLNEFGAEFQGTGFEVNVIYGGGKLDADGAVLRIRHLATGSTLTYKRRVGDQSAIKRQTEFETVIGDPAAMTEIAAALGFVPRVVYEKRRRTWKFGSVEVVIDELPFGWFMEIEGAVTAIGEAEVMLGAEEIEAVQSTYPALTLAFGTERNGIFEARFKASECT